MQRLGSIGTARGRTPQIAFGQIQHEGELSVPVDATGVVLFAHGSGSSRHSPRKNAAAKCVLGKLDLKS